MTATDIKEKLVSQDEIDEMLRIHEIIRHDDERGGPSAPSLLDEIKGAILDSGKLTLDEWKSLRRKIKEIEELIPHMDVIIRLKEQQERRRGILGN